MTRPIDSMPLVEHLEGISLESIASDLRPLAIRVEGLTPDPVNARTHDRRNLDAIKGSLQAFGQRTPLVVQREGMIVRKGNGTLQAAKELGWEAIAAVVVDEANLDAVTYAIADNKSAELAEWDHEALSGILSALPEENRPTTGFEDYEIEAIMKAEWKPVIADSLKKNDDTTPEMISFDVTKEQADIINVAVEKLREHENDTEISIGRALELICADFIS